MSAPHQGSEEFLTRLNGGFARLAGWSFDHRWLVLGVSLALLGGCLWLAGSVRQDNSYSGFFSASDETYLFYESYREDFGSDEVSYILYEAPGFEHGPWNLEVMRKLASLTTALEDEVAFVYEVTTLVNAELIQGVPDGIEIFELADDFPETQAELLALREAYLSKPMLVGGILSEDAAYGAIIIELDRASTDPMEDIVWDPEQGHDLENLYPQVTMGHIEAILARPEYEGIDFYHAGDVPMNAIYNRLIFGESAKLNMITALVVGLLLAYCFRSVPGVLAPIIVVQFSVFACLALVGLLGWSVGMSFGAVPTLLTAIGVAHSVHILSEFRGRFAVLGDRREALVQTFSLVGAPCLLTSVTTAVGFGAMGAVPIRNVGEQGVFSAFGVMAAFVLSFTLLAALLSLGSRTREREPELAVDVKGGDRLRRALTAVVHFDRRHRRGILVVSAMVALVAIAGISRLVADSNWLADFTDRVPLKSISLKVDEVMGGTTNVIYLFDSGEPDGIKEPAFLREMERLQAVAAAYDPSYVRKTYSIVDILKDLNQAFHGGDPAYYRLPESREQVAQYLLLYEMSGGEETEEYVTPEYRRASLELRVTTGSARDTEQLIQAMDAHLEQVPLEEAEVATTGIGALWVVLVDRIVESQVRGFLLAFGAIALVMVLLFRSLAVGGIAMVPNLAPVILTLGTMGWLGILLDYSKVGIAAVALGIAVDDTIHLVTRYRHEFRLRGDYFEALLASVQDVGRALVITSTVLVCGFLVLTLSIMATNVVQGVLLATTIVTALVADFFLMPALIMTFHPFGPEGAGENSRNLEEAA